MSIARPELENEVEWNLVDFVRKLVRRRRTVLIFVLGGLVLGILIAVLWPQWYSAEAVFLPPRATEAVGSGLIGGGGSGSASAAAASALMLQQDPSDVYLGMLSSRSVQDDVIDHLGLMKIYQVKSPGAARGILTKKSKFKVTKNSFIQVDVKAKTPKLASDIANAYLDALYRLNGSMVASASAHRSAFFEKQLADQKEALDASEVALKQAEEKTGILLPEGAAQADLRTIVDLQTAIGAAEARLSRLRVGATEDNPQVVQARAELSALRAQLARQQAATAKKGRAQGLASTTELPGLSMELVRKMRDVKLNEALYDSLTAQYERARISSLDPGPQLQVVDRAIEPEGVAGPWRALIIAAGAILGLFAGLAWVILQDPVANFIQLIFSEPAANRAR